MKVKTPAELEGLDGIVFPGGESTAMGLIGKKTGIWEALQSFTKTKPTWGTCAGMILLADRCVGASAVIENGQSLIGGVDVLVCRNYFGSQISSFEMETPAPPNATEKSSYPGVFIRAPAILSVGKDIEVLGRVLATPCRTAGAVLRELDEKIAKGENITMLKVVSDPWNKKNENDSSSFSQEEKKMEITLPPEAVQLPGASEDGEAREVICAIRKSNILCTAFHPEVTNDSRWHAYFLEMVKQSASS